MPPLRAATNNRRSYTYANAPGPRPLDRRGRLHRRAAPPRVPVLGDVRNDGVRPGSAPSHGVLDVRLLAELRRPAPGGLPRRPARRAPGGLAARLDRHPSRARRLHGRPALHPRPGPPGLRGACRRRRAPEGLDQPRRPGERAEPAPPRDARRCPGIALLPCGPGRRVRHPLPLGERAHARDRPAIPARPAGSRAWRTAGASGWSGRPASSRTPETGSSNPASCATAARSPSSGATAAGASTRSRGCPRSSPPRCSTGSARPAESWSSTFTSVLRETRRRRSCGPA